MSKAPQLATLATPETIPENRLAKAAASEILRNAAEMLSARPLLEAAFQDETGRFSLTVRRLEQEAFNPEATLEAVEELYGILQCLLETYCTESGDPDFTIPPCLQDDFETKLDLLRAAVFEEVQEEVIHETAKLVILGHEKAGITKVDLSIRKQVAQEIMAIIAYAMRDFYLKYDESRIPVSEILESVKSSTILALMVFNDSLLDIMAKGPESDRRELAMIIKAVRSEIKKNKIPNPKKRRESELPIHDPSAPVEGFDLGGVMDLERTIVRQSSRHSENTGVHEVPKSSPDGK